MRLLTLLTGYAAWLAVAMKYRKDSGKSKIKKDSNKSNMDLIIDEIVDIHKSVYADIKSTVTATWEEVEDFDGLKAKVSTLVDTFTSEVESKIESLRASGKTKREELTSLADKALEDNEASLESARDKALALGDVALDTLDTFITDAKSKLNAAHKKIKSKIEKEVV